MQFLYVFLVLVQVQGNEGLKIKTKNMFRDYVSEKAELICKPKIWSSFYLYSKGWINKSAAWQIVINWN